MQDFVGDRPTIAIVGAGFSGALTAIHLLRAGTGAAARLVLVNRSGTMARGVAYGTRSPLHVLNVPAARMSAFEDRPDDFLRFCRALEPNVEAADFVPRGWYGTYLERALERAEAASDLELERVVDEAIGIEVLESTRARVALASGTSIDCNRVVLALGNYPPQDPAIRDPGFYASARYVRDPWRSGALEGIGVEEAILLVGTGLTMIDVVVDLAQRGHRGPLIAISRRGLVPQAHRTAGSTLDYPALPEGLFVANVTARRCMREIRQHVETLASRGVDWRDTMAALRAATPALWDALSLREQSRFLRHARPYWDVHRHRAAPAPAKLMHEWIETGRLVVKAARLLACRERPDGVEVDVRTRGRSEIEPLAIGRVINCTGPAGDTRTLRDPLLTSMRDAGLAVADPLGLGLDVSAEGALIDAAGRTSRVLFHVGPFLKARHFEATAVPELRVHAARLAAHLCASARPTEKPEQPFACRAAA